jgi:hypothetical protein
MVGSIACIAVIGAVSYVTVSYVRGGAPIRNSGDASDRISPSARFPAEDYEQSHFPRKGTRPLIGVNYTHHEFPNCDPTGTGILKTLHEEGVFEKVHRQLSTMRSNGITAIRTIIWNITDASQQTTGTISSAGGEVREPYQTNLVRYLTEIKKFGFRRLTIAFSPQGTNNPILPAYDPAKFDENWNFIKVVRSLLKRHGPAETRIDLLNEGAPSRYMPTALRQQLESYVGQMYERYDAAFGSRDVTVSLVAPRKPADMGARLQNLINILRVNGLPQPRWYDVHIGYTSEKAKHGLRDSDFVLSRNRRRQPLVIGETAYNDRPVARSISEFIQRASRRIEEVSPWYIQRERGCRLSPPYDSRAYRTALGTAQPPS